MGSRFRRLRSPRSSPQEGRAAVRRVSGAFAPVWRPLRPLRAHVACDRCVLSCGFGQIYQRRLAWNARHSLVFIAPRWGLAIAPTPYELVGGQSMSVWWKPDRLLAVIVFS